MSKEKQTPQPRPTPQPKPKPPTRHDEPKPDRKGFPGHSNPPQPPPEKK